MSNSPTKPLKSAKATRWVLLFLTWVAFLLRTVTLSGQSLWRDEVDAIRFSAWPLTDLINGLLQPGHNGPLYFLLLGLWRNLAGISEFGLRYPSALLGVLAVPLGFALARQLGLSRWVGLWLGLLLSTSPYLVWYGQEAKMYTLLLVLVLTAFVTYLKALVVDEPQARRWLWPVFVVAASLSFYTHILAPLMLVVYTAIALYHWSHWRRRWCGWLVSMACLTLPYLPLAWWQTPLWFNGFQSGHPYYSLNQIVWLLFQLYSSGLLRFVGVTAIVLYVFLFLCGLFLSPRNPSLEKNARYRFPLMVWTLLPPLLVYLISLRVQVFEDRYLIYIVPGFYLLILVGLLRMRDYSPRLAGLGLGLILSINLLGIWQQQRQPIKADFRAAAAYLANQAQPPEAIMVQMPYLQHTLNYYYRPKYRLLEGLWTNDGKSEAEVDRQMQTITADLADLWLVSSEAETWDQRGLVRAWLDTHAELANQATFVRVAVYHYRLRPGLIEGQSVGEGVR